MISPLRWACDTVDALATRFPGKRGLGITWRAWSIRSLAAFRISASDPSHTCAEAVGRRRWRWRTASLGYMFLVVPNHHSVLNHLAAKSPLPYFVDCILNANAVGENLNAFSFVLKPCNCVPMGGHFPLYSGVCFRRLLVTDQFEKLVNP